MSDLPIGEKDQVKQSSGTFQTKLNYTKWEETYIIEGAIKLMMLVGVNYHSDGQFLLMKSYLQ